MSRILEGQIALITGASSGIGASIAREFAIEGAHVVVNYAGRADRAEEVVSDIKGHGQEALAIKADVSNEAEVKEMFQKAIERFGRIDILVNNAGIQADAPFVEMSLEKWQRVIDVNLTGAFLCAREAARHFLKTSKVRKMPLGKIIFISSVHEIIPWAGHVNYAASKGGLMLLMKSIAQELGPQGIRVNSIAPGAIKTPINRPAWESKEAEERLLKLIPYGRVGETIDIARAAVWLASDEFDYVHGTTLIVDGGMCLYPGFAEGG
ncbi:MAG: glucose 1-dehydrogenase [Nitrospirae bacterium]|nr:MAG: glucose 1-dehydrogenase [Nitrospirota bacterium]